MKGGVTYKDLDAWKRKARAFDEALAYLDAHSDSESSNTARDILRRAVEAKPMEDAGRLTR